MYRATALLTPSVGQSTLIDQGGTTLDDQTNLQWLDLTVFQGQSLKDFEDSAYFANSYRVATLAEVIALFTGNGVALSNGLTPQERADQLDEALTIVNLLGPMNDIGGLHGFTDWVFIGGGNPVNDNYENVTADILVDGGVGDFYINATGGATYQSTNNSVGLFIVRAIPEPSTALLLAFGLAGLSLRRRGSR